MRIHLVTYATPRFRLRQLVLGWSARLNRVTDTVTHWTPEKLLSAGFEDRCKDIKLTERGSGFWAWKPFIIDAKLREIPEGDVIFYCDVGRLYPYKILDQPITAYLVWMSKRKQDIMPGVMIPWDGETSVWTKREALIATDMDRPEIHKASPIQASFSIWRSSTCSKELAAQWLELCSYRHLISDDPSRNGIEELAGFRGHRHDQALLTLCCIKKSISGIDLGGKKPDVDCRHPSEVGRLLNGNMPKPPTTAGRLLQLTTKVLEIIEKNIRHHVRFGKHIHE
jgi:hypothetical protein